MAKGDKKAALDEMGIDVFCEKIMGGMMMLDVAKEAGVTHATLMKWLAADGERSARAREARIISAGAYDAKATRGIEEAGDAFELAKAKEMAHHYRWRASKIAPSDYGDKVQIGGASDLPPVKSSVEIDPSEAYKALINKGN